MVIARTCSFTLQRAGFVCLYLKDLKGWPGTAGERGLGGEGREPGLRDGCVRTQLAWQAAAHCHLLPPPEAPHTISSHAPSLPHPLLCSLTYPPSVRRLETVTLQRVVDRPPPSSHKKKKNLITVVTIRIRSGLNAPIDNHSWDCISKRKPAKSGLVDSQRPWKTHRLSLRLLSIAQKERGRAGLWVISSKQCAVERYL